MGGGAAPGSTNSWSDTAHACCPTGTLVTKGGVSGPAERGVRGQVAVSLPRKQPRAGTRQQRVGVVTPSLHPEVPGTRFASWT